MLCNTTDAVERALNAARQSNKLVYDTETSGIKRFSNHVIGHVITVGPSPDDTFYIPLRHAGGGNFPGCTVPQTEDGWDGTTHRVEEELAKIFASNPGRLVIGHNIQFDAWHARRAGVVLPNKLSDTMLNQSLINEHQPSMSLEACCKALGVQEKKGEPLYQYLAGKFGGEPTQKQMANYWKTNASEFIVHDYASGDGTSTWQLYDQQMVLIEEQDLKKVYEVECRVIPVVHSMIWRGIKIDEERLHQVKQICSSRLEKARNSFPSSLNLRSGKQLADYFTKNGVLDFPTTEKGNPSFTEEWLVSNELGKRVVVVRKYETLMSSFIEPMLGKHLHNGRCHPWYNQSRDDVRGTITGRFSSSEPNIQQISHRNVELGGLFRSIFVPDEGKIWADIDFSQQEPTTLAHYMCGVNNNNVLAVGYRQDPPVDSHTSVAAAAKIDRSSAKRINQGLISGAGKGKIISEMAARGKTPAEALKIYDDYFRAMPELRVLQKQMAAVYRGRGYIRTLLGRHCHIEAPQYDYRALSRALQGTGADFIKVKMVECHEYLQSENADMDILASVHDSMDVQFTEESRPHYEEFKRIMTSFGPDDLITLRVPLRVDAKEGKTWAHATFGQDLQPD